MINIIKFELYKSIKKTNLKVIIISILLLVLATSLYKFHYNQDENWKEELLNANIQYKRQIESTDNLSDNLRNIFNDNIKLNSYYINNNINPKEMNLWKFLDESSILTLIIIIYGIITSSSNLPREINNGTLGLLVTKHYKRKEIFFRKIIKFCTFKFNAIYLFVYNHIYNWYSIMGNRWY